MGLTPGQKAPDFTLQSDDGSQVSLRDFAGKKVILYFYPRDQTPGCTAEACDFRDALPSVSRKGAVVLGVSKDSLASHKKFRDKHGLNFPLLSDPDATVMKAYGAFGEKTMYGKKVLGTIRTTVVIDERGRVAQVWSGVKVPGHVAEVTEAL